MDKHNAVKGPEIVNLDEGSEQQKLAQERAHFTQTITSVEPSISP